MFEVYRYIETYPRGKISCCAQAVAALSELAIPHFTTATIFSVTESGSSAKFYQNVRMLAVSFHSPASASRSAMLTSLACAA